jgi:bifunctional non-homologous end joining protein LigD
MAKKKITSEGAFTASHPDKIYWPAEGYTKQDMMDYYQSVSSYILPFLKNRPMVLRRFPDGIEGQNFVQKDTHSLHLKEGIETINIAHEGRTIAYFLIQDESALSYVVNLGSIELHPFHSQIDHLDFPDYFILDMDPESVPFETVIRTAQQIHQLLDEWDIPHYCKTSGGRGLHMYIPLHGQYHLDQVSQFGTVLGEMLHVELPKITSLERSPSKRQGKIYLDVLQNRSRQTVVAPYSLRGRPGATVSTPILWDELKKGLTPQKFNIKTVPPRLKEVGEIFSPVLKQKFNMKKWLSKVVAAT